MKKVLTFLKKLKIRDYVTAVLLVLALVCFIVFQQIAGLLPTMNAAKVWAGQSDMRFAQIACFFTPEGSITPETVYAFRYALEQKMVENSLEAPEGGSLYRDAWSGGGEVTVTTSHGTATASTLGVGGDWFLFHPLYLRSGSYLRESDLMQDLVVLDEEMAWALFGGTDVAGLTVEISGKPYQVAGVVRREQDFASETAYTDGPGMFMNFDALNALSETKIDCYEIVLPNDVSGYGMGLVTETFPAEIGARVENSDRYSLGRLLGVAGDFGRRSMRTDGVIFPYWENAARLTEDYLALLVVLMGLLLLFPAVRLVIFVICTIVRLYRRAKAKVPAAVEQRVEERREKQYEKAGVD